MNEFIYTAVRMEVGADIISMVTSMRKKDKYRENNYTWNHLEKKEIRRYKWRRIC